MNHLGVAFAVEARKAAASRVFRTITWLLLAGLGVLSGSLVLAVRAGNEQVAGRLGPLGELDGWPLLSGAVMQIAAAGGLLAFGVAVSWIVAREFADGTITGLFAVPIRRSTIAVAKLAVFLVWAVMVGLGLTLTTGLLGVFLGYGLPADEDGVALLRLFVLSVFTALSAVPAGWAATLGRGILPGIAATIAIVVIAQVGVLSGLGGWTPFGAPALWAMTPEAVAPVQLLPTLLISAAFCAATVIAWKRLQLDR
ncbi:ABC transporter permease [Arthrobacter antioxidans]|uniref:ABC transporter permease n=1 Tax=Arthrobacter antioxidans TaxID=2895818 RepID=UPI001FFF758F|nr:ABC transporter permease [Arthrobacter antioxidans]